jgi:FkbM family methyltransferase
MPSVASVNWPRCVAKFLLFIGRGTSPATAWWLARHDAPKQYDYRGVQRNDLMGAWTATARWHDLVVANGKIHSRRVNLPFQGNDLLTRGYATMLAMQELGFVLERQDGVFLLSNKIWRLRVTNDEEVSMIREIFVDGCYDLRLAGQWNVLDIGANVGMASLFFAAQPWVDRVIAFEPFGPTADEHATQMALNPSLASKITLNRYGLDEDTKLLEVDYHQDLRGSMSIHGLGVWRAGTDAQTKKISVQVRRASEVLAELGPTLAGKRTCAKIDCEGSEYGILRDLERSDSLRHIDLIVMEWHKNRPDELIERLKHAGFAQQVRAAVDDQTQGLIVAWRDPVC